MEVPLAQIVREQIDTHRYELLDIRAEHVLALDVLPRHHGDPFDRLLIAQAQTGQVPLVSTDSVFTHNLVGLFWQNDGCCGPKSHLGDCDRGGTPTARAAAEAHPAARTPGQATRNGPEPAVCRGERQGWRP